MDQETLLDEHVKDGKRLVNELVANNFPVLAAFWAKLDETAKWYLYVISPVVERDGPRAAYRQMQPVIGKLQEGAFWIDPFEIKAVGPKDPLANAVLEIQQRSSGLLPMRLRGARVGGLSVEGSYIYPPIEAIVS